MRFFLDNRKIPASEELGTKVTKSYLEFELPANSENSLILYLIPRSESSAFLATCWDHAFDDVLGDLDEDKLGLIADTWPTLMILMHNGLNDLYQNGALILLEDADYGEKKWFVASIAGNISFDSVEDLLGNERVLEAIDAVMGKTLQLFSELTENKPNWLKQTGKGILKGIGLGLLAGVAAVFGVDSST